MNQIKFFKFTICGLILLNIFTLGFFLLTKPNQRGHPPLPNKGFKDEVASILDLNNEQQSIFNEFAEQHEQQIRTINEQQEKLLLPYFENIVNPSIELNTELVPTQFQQLQRQKLVLTRQHFIKTKELLNKKQLPEFKVFMERVTEKIVVKRKNKPPRPKDF